MLSEPTPDPGGLAEIPGACTAPGGLRWSDTAQSSWLVHLHKHHSHTGNHPSLPHCTQDKILPVHISVICTYTHNVRDEGTE